MGVVLLAAAVGAVIGQVMAAGGWPTLAGWPRLVAALVAAGYGGWVYHLQRDAIRGQQQAAGAAVLVVSEPVVARSAA